MWNAFKICMCSVVYTLDVHTEVRDICFCSMNQLFFHLFFSFKVTQKTRPTMTSLPSAHLQLSHIFCVITMRICLLCKRQFNEQTIQWSISHFKLYPFRSSVLSKRPNECRGMASQKQPHKNTTFHHRDKRTNKDTHTHAPQQCFLNPFELIKCVSKTNCFVWLCDWLLCMHEVHTHDTKI